MNVEILSYLGLRALHFEFNTLIQLIVGAIVAGLVVLYIYLRKKWKAEQLPAVSGDMNLPVVQKPDNSKQ